MEAVSVEDMFAHMQWADASVWEAALAAPDGTRDERLRSTLLHLHLVQRGFLGLWCATFRSPLSEVLDSQVDPNDFESALELRDWARRYYAWAREFFSGVDPSDLDRAVDIPWANDIEKQLGKPAKPVTLRETLYQVVAHSMYHRGQANRRIRELGGEPPLTDYIAWLWMDRPRPVW